MLKQTEHPVKSGFLNYFMDYSNEKYFKFHCSFFEYGFQTIHPQKSLCFQIALDYPRTQHMISRIKKLNRKALIINIPTNTPPRPNLTGKALYKFLKETIILCVRSEKYMHVFASPGRIAENIGIMGNLHFHCPLRCKFCYVDLAGQGTRWNRVYVDLEKFYDQAVKERLVYKMVLTLWSIISFQQKSTLNKVPKKFKQFCDKVIRKNVLNKRKGITNDQEAIRFLKRNLKSFFNDLGIKLSREQESELKKVIPDYYAKNSQFPLSINISEYSDVLGLDHITNTLDELMQLVHKDSEFRIRFRTKAANIHNLLKYDGKNQVKVTYGLNTEYVISKYEKGTASLSERIAAINALVQRGGYEVELAVEPIIKYDGYEDDYQALIQKIKMEIDLSKVAKIKVGTVRYQTKMINYINNVHPTSGLLSRNQKLVEPEQGDKRWRYSKAERMKIYSIIKSELDDVPNVALGLGSENPELWDELGLDKTDIHSDVVYQYIEEIKIMIAQLKTSNETIGSLVIWAALLKQKGRNKMKNKLKIPIVALTIIYRTDSGEDDSTTSYNPKIYNKKMLCKLDFVAHLYRMRLVIYGGLLMPNFLKPGLIQ